jgi:adenylate kinase family enzyme
MQRVVVWGATGSGKTTFARRLGAALGLPAIELDGLFWQPNWAESETEPFRLKVQAAFDAAPDGWVCDGNYGGRLRDLASGQADTVVWLHLPWRVSFWRVFKRTVSRAWTKEPMWAGNTESWRLSFMSKDSILWWSIRHHQDTVRSARAKLATLDSGKRVYELRSTREVEVFLSAAEQREREQETVG